jgi:hypothetical protein
MLISTNCVMISTTMTQWNVWAIAPHRAVVFRIGMRLSSSNERSLQNPDADGRAYYDAARQLRERAGASAAAGTIGSTAGGA